MASSKDFRDQMLGRLLPFGPVLSRSMFGGFGFYMDGVMFALIAYDRIYFKVDDDNRQEYIDAGTGPFTYEGKRKPVQMSYFLVPSDVLDDPIELAEWAGRALDAAKRSKTTKPTRRKS
jgi:DNA transformation protein and related proteins